jgi:hypothetical protein
VTVARMIGMAIGLAILTAYGSTTIDDLSSRIDPNTDSYLQLIPEALRDRPFKDPLVVAALEAWASREAAAIMVGLFVVAAIVTLAAIPAALALGSGGPRRARRAEDIQVVPVVASPPTGTRMLSGDDGQDRGLAR